LGYLRKDDGISPHRKRQLADAKAKVLELYAAGYYFKPLQPNEISKFWKNLFGIIRTAGITGMRL